MDDLKITGRVTQVLEEQSGQGRNGLWRKREFILETPGDYPKQVCCVQWGDNIDKNPVEVGQELTAHIDIQSREYNGRWYTDVKAWRIEGASADGGAAQGTGPGAPGADSPAAGETGSGWGVDEDDDLPF